MHVELLILPYSVVKMVMKEIRVGGSVLTETEFFLLNKKFFRHFSKLERIKLITQTSRPTLITVNVQLIIFILTDIDECATKTHNCNLKANCTNNNGSFECVCKEGYTGDGKSCSGKTHDFNRWINWEKNITLLKQVKNLLKQGIKQKRN